MPTYKLSPVATLVESRLFAAATEYAVFHRLSSQLVQPEPAVLSWLQAAERDNRFSLDPEQLTQLGETGRQIRKLIALELLIPEGHDPLAAFVDCYVNRPLQNPAITYQNETGDVMVVSIPMAEKVYSPERGQLPPVIEESFPKLTTEILVAADGTKTLREIHAALRREGRTLLEDQEFRQAIEFLTQPDRQLIKFAPTPEGFADPFYPANVVPRNLYHALRWTESKAAKSIADFHVEGIEDALWEFDIVEPTVNHGLRFPSTLLSGLDYGTRFCDAVFTYVFPTSHPGTVLDVLEVGGGTGSFARSFIQRAKSKVGSLLYQIMDLSPALAEKQRQTLRDIEVPVGYLSHDAIRFDLPGRKFDLIVSNEVIADFPVATVERLPAGNGAQWKGDGATYVEKYLLSVDDAPARFYVNAGVFRFLERAWEHLNPGGALVLSEYGSKSLYPAESFHLNHSEFTIHFGHVSQCAEKIGFECELVALTEFLAIDTGTPVLNGREEHILCLNHVFEKFGNSVPFALFSEVDFKARFSDLARRLRVGPIRFLPLRSNFHYGPNLGDFFVLILIKPRRNS